MNIRVAFDFGKRSVGQVSTPPYRAAWAGVQQAFSGQQPGRRRGGPASRRRRPEPLTRGVAWRTGGARAHVSRHWPREASAMPPARAGDECSMPTSEREVRLRPEFAAIYDQLQPGVWMPAHTVAEAVVRQASAARRLSIYRRTLDASHFEFRGGADEARPADTRTRTTDSRRRRGRE